MKKVFYILTILTLPFYLKSQSLYFPPLTGNSWDTLSPQRLNWCQERIDSLYYFLEDNNTKSFILLKDGKIVLEKYFGSQTQNSLWYWASAGKSLTSFLAGLAQQENKLQITDLSSKYLGKGWTSCTSDQEDNITLKHQLSMTSGLEDAGVDPYCYLDSCLTYKADAGTRWAYHNAPYTLLDSIIEIATGIKLNTYFNSRIKTQTGITGAFLKSGFNNVFYSTARNMAKYGLFILNKGNWNGNQIMSDQDYFYQMTHSSQNINPAYGYLWWLNGSNTYRIPQTQFNFPGPLSPNAPSDMISALGKNGQFINVIPSQNLVWIRMGDAPDNSLVPFILNDDIWKYLNKLNCIKTVIEDNKDSNPILNLFVNTDHKTIHIQSSKEIKFVEIYTLQGILVTNQTIQNNDAIINIPESLAGIAIIKTKFTNGENLVRKIFLNN